MVKSVPKFPFFTYIYTYFGHWTHPDNTCSKNNCSKWLFNR